MEEIWVTVTWPWGAKVSLACARAATRFSSLGAAAPVLATSLKPIHVTLRPRLDLLERQRVAEDGTQQDGRSAHDAGYLDRDGVQRVVGEKKSDQSVFTAFSPAVFSTIFFQNCFFVHRFLKPCLCVAAATAEAEAGPGAASTMPPSLRF